MAACYAFAVKRAIFSLLIFVISCAGPPEARENRIHISLQSGDQEVRLWVEIADDPIERAEGLMNRKSMPEDEGMLFIFEEPLQLSFWMKNTLIPLDVLYFDENMRYINTQSMNPCKSDPCRTYDSDRAAKYALEVNQGAVASMDWMLTL